MRDSGRDPGTDRGSGEARGGRHWLRRTDARAGGPDGCDQVIRPAILWNDGRTAKQTEYLNQVDRKRDLSKYTANIAFAGFTAPKLLWMQEEEPEHFAKIAKIMLPKDYLSYRLSGVHCTDYSDASGMLLLDVEHKCWSKEMMEICHVREEQLPKLFESYEAVGTLKPGWQKELGLSDQVKIVGGSRGQCGCGRGNRNRGRRAVQYLPWDLRDHFHFQQDIWRGPA